LVLGCLVHLIPETGKGHAVALVIESVDPLLHAHASIQSELIDRLAVVHVYECPQASLYFVVRSTDLGLEVLLLCSVPGVGEGALGLFLGDPLVPAVRDLV
jgi:hypothetical protein